MPKMGWIENILSFLEIITPANILVYCDSSCGSSVACSVYYFASFYMRQKVSCSFVLPLAPDPGDATGRQSTAIL